MNEKRQAVNVSIDDVATCIAKGDHCPDTSNSDQVKLCCYATAYDIAERSGDSKYNIEAVKKRIEDTLTSLLKNETVPDYPRIKDDLFHHFIPYDCVSIIYYLSTQSEYQHYINRQLNGKTPLHLAIEANNVTMCKLLVVAGADMTVGSYGEQRLTVLHSAAIHGADDIVCYLLSTLTATLTKEELTAFINCQGEYGETALYQAARNGYFSMVKHLVAYDADSLQPNDIGELPVVGAIKGCCTAKAASTIDLTCHYLLERTGIHFIQDNFNALCRSALVGGLEKTVDFFLQQDEALSLLEKDKIDFIETAFHCIEKSQLEQDETGDVYKRLALALISADFNITAPFDSFCGSALSKAVALGLTDVVEQLVQRNVAPKKNDAGDYPLHFNAKSIRDNKEITEHLLKHDDAGITEPNVKGECPLHLAASTGNWRILDCLLSKSKAIINQPDCEGKTPLHRAAQATSIHSGDRTESDYITVIKSLIQAGADVRRKDNDDKVAGDYAASANIKQLFLKSQSSTAPQPFALWQHWQPAMISYYTNKEMFVEKPLFNEDYFSLADYFVNLQVVRERDNAADRQQPVDDKSVYKPLRERDRLVGDKKTIKPNDLFHSSNYQDSDRKPLPSVNTVVVSGAAGVGKTTLIDYIAYQWALFKQGKGKAGLWSDFETVLIVRCRELQPKELGLGKKTKDIEELLLCTCWGSLDIRLDEARQLLTTLKRTPESCLLLLDGLDELPVPKKTYWRNLLKKLFQLPFKKLVTTRPYAIGKLRHWISHEGLVEISGFTDSNVAVYFEKVLGQSKETGEFIQAVKKNPDLWAVTRIPIHAYLLRSWWVTTGSQSGDAPLATLSISDLYRSLIVNVCRRYLVKTDLLNGSELLDDNVVLDNPRVHRLLDTLGRWAFEGLRQDSAQLPMSWLSGIQGSDEKPTLLSTNQCKQLNVDYLKQVGLLKEVGSNIGAQQRFEFLHLSFQEFLAANVIAVMLRQGAKEQKTHVTQVIYRYKYHPNFTLVWPLVAGLLKRYPEALNDFLSILVAGPKDWVGFVEADFLMRCLTASLPSSADTKALGLPQQVLLRAVKQRIKQLNKLPETWQEATIDTLSMCPSLIRLNVDTVLAFLRDEKVDGFVRVELARSTVAHWSPTPEGVEAVWALLRNEKVDGYVRGDLASSIGAHWPPTPEWVEMVLALLRDEKVDGYVRVELARSTVAHWPPTSEGVEVVLTLLRNEKVYGHIRAKLARSTVAHWSPIPEWEEVVLALLRDEKVDGYVRVELARSAVAHWPPTPEWVEVVLALLRNEKVDGFVRVELARSAVAHWPPTPEGEEVVLVFLRDEKVDGFVRVELARSAVAHWPPTPEGVEVVLAFLRDEKVDGYVRVELARSTVAHWPPTPEGEEVVLTLLRNEKVDGDVRIELARSTVAHWPPTPEGMEVVLTLLRNEKVDGDVRVELARSTVAHWPPTPEWEEVVLALLRNKKVDGYVRVELARSAFAHWPPTPEGVETVLAFLRDKKVDGDVRVELARSAFAHWPPTPEGVEVVLTLLRDEKVDGYVRVELARSAFAHWPPTPEWEEVVLALLRDEKVDGYVRVELARSAVAHWPPTPEGEEVVLTLLRNEKVYGHIRAKLARSTVAHWSPTPEWVEAVWAFLRNEKVDGDVRVELARSTVAHWPPTPEGVEGVWALLRNEKVDGDVRVELARSTVAHWPPTPEGVEVVLTLLWNEKVDGDVRVELARSTAAHWPPTPEGVEVVWALLRDKKVDEYDRGKLASDAFAHWPPTPEGVETVLAFLRDKKVGEYVHVKLASSVIQQWPKLPNKAQAFLDSLFVKDSNGKDLSGDVDIPVHLLLPLYQKTHDQGRQYIREQLVKHRVLVYEQAGTVLVTQAGQTEKLKLPRPIIQEIQKDMQPYRINIDDSVGMLSKLNLFSSEHTEKSNEQTSCSNIRPVMQ